MLFTVGGEETSADLRRLFEPQTMVLVAQTVQALSRPNAPTGPSPRARTRHNREMQAFWMPRFASCIPSHPWTSVTGSVAASPRAAWRLDGSITIAT